MGNKQGTKPIEDTRKQIMDSHVLRELDLGKKEGLETPRKTGKESILTNTGSNVSGSIVSSPVFLPTNIFLGGRNLSKVIGRRPSNHLPRKSAVFDNAKTDQKPVFQHPVKVLWKRVENLRSVSLNGTHSFERTEILSPVSRKTDKNLKLGRSQSVFKSTPAETYSLKVIPRQRKPTFLKKTEPLDPVNTFATFLKHAIQAKISFESQVFKRPKSVLKFNQSLTPATPYANRKGMTFSDAAKEVEMKGNQEGENKHFYRIRRSSQVGKREETEESGENKQLGNAEHEWKWTGKLTKNVEKKENSRHKRASIALRT